MEPSAQEREFGAAVERSRDAARVTQDWVARQIGLARSKVSEIGSGRYLPNRPVLDALIIALAMDRERTVALWHAAHEGRQARLHAERQARQPAPAEWTALSPLPPQLRSLLRAQQRMAQDLPYKLPGARRSSLGTVYVRQGLGSGVEDSQPEQPPRPEPVLDERGILHLPAQPRRRLAVRPPSRPVRDALDEHEHLVVTGGPGQGKSTLSLRLSAEIATVWMAPDNGQVAPLAERVVPLRLTARELAARLDQPWCHALAASIRGMYGALLASEISPHLLAERVAGCRWLLLVDGLDEIAASDRRDRLVTVLTEWAGESAGSPYRILLTTRPVESAALIPLHLTAAHYELQPFDEQALRTFAEHWFADDGPDGGHGVAERFLRQIRDAYLDELVQVPLLATIAAIVFEQHTDRPLPDNQYELYEAYLTYLRTGRANIPTRFDRVREGLLEHLGTVRLEQDTSLTAAARDWITQHAVPDGHPTGWREELTTFLTTAGPLVTRGDDVQFLHHSFAEHLAATAKARQLPEPFDPKQHAFARLLHTACQGDRGRHARTVLLHYTRLHPAEADRLLRWLHLGSSELHLLAARLLAQHMPVTAEPVDAYLATARGWALTTNYHGSGILDQVSRAAHHPGLIPWLGGLMRDEAAPWPSRIEAATAIATRLRKIDTDEAIAMLRAVVHDEDVPVEDRLTAAESLAECGEAEKHIAEHKLAVLLADPVLPPRRRKNAAVVLAGLGPQARRHAVDLLLASLDDPDTPVDDVVEAAAALTEIGTEFHGRCAEVFRAVMHDCGRSIRTRKEAAIGLATLGPKPQKEAVEVLTQWVNDRSLKVPERAIGADALAEFGSQYRTMTAGYLKDILAEPGLDLFDRRSVASCVAALGPEFLDEAAAYLRAVIADRDAGANASYWAIEALAGLGAEFRAEAVLEFQRLADDPLVDGFEHAYGLGHIARLDESQRSVVVNQLRIELADRDTDPEDRMWAARELVALGPEFHPDAVSGILAVIDDTSDPSVLADAWPELARLGNRFRRPAMHALLTLLQSPVTGGWAIFVATNWLVEVGGVGRQHVAEALVAALTDENRSGYARIQSASALVRLGRPYHRTAAHGIVELLWTKGDLGWKNSPLYVDDFRAIGDGPCAELVDALRMLLPTPDAQPEQIERVARALVQLGDGESLAVTTALCAVAADEYTDESTRWDAVAVLAKLDRDRISDAMAVLRAIALSTRQSARWERAVLALARSGGDVVPHVRALLDNQDVARSVQASAASMLAKLEPELVDVAVGVLRRHAEDVHLSRYQHAVALERLGKLDPASLGHAIAAQRDVVDDEGEPTAIRIVAAYQLIQLDRAYWPSVTATLRRIAINPHCTPADRGQAVILLGNVKMLKPREAMSLRLAIVQDPATPPDVRRRLTGRLPPTMRLGFERALLADHDVPISARLPTIGFGDPFLLRAEAEAVIRDVLTAVESRLPERIDAAAELAGMSPRFVPEAIQSLEALARLNSHVSVQAQVKLARLSGIRRRHIIEQAEQAIADESRPIRDQYRALDVLGGIASSPTTAMVRFLRVIASDERTSDRRRVDSLFTLGQADGLAPLRTLRDDVRTTPAARWRAAVKLIDYTIGDRAAAARILHGIATDSTMRAALRWRAAQDLATLGPGDRDLAIDALRALGADTAQPATARVNAARVLVEIRPTCIREALDVLHGLTTTANPLHRVRVYRAIGTIDTTIAAPALRTMADDRTLSPVARLRSAEAVASLRRDYREAAAIVARELMHDHTVSRHVRATAARDLARWSALCRQEARDWLRTMSHAR